VTDLINDLEVEGGVLVHCLEIEIKGADLSHEVEEAILGHDPEVEGDDLGAVLLRKEYVAWLIAKSTVYTNIMGCLNSNNKEIKLLIKKDFLPKSSSKTGSRAATKGFVRTCWTNAVFKTRKNKLCRDLLAWESMGFLPLGYEAIGFEAGCIFVCVLLFRAR
jgi:hypothetical protein